MANARSSLSASFLALILALLAACGGDDTSARCMEADPLPGDGCCPSGATQATDGDCAPACGNGAQESGESCDIAITPGSVGACPATDADCDDALACTIDTVSGSGCVTMCVHAEISAVGLDDGCCPAGATADDDIDCAEQCGNGRVDPGETCDTGIPAGVGRCVNEIDCDDADACTDDSVLSEGTCQAVCLNVRTTMLENGDACCAVGGNANTDSDCAPVCGNGTLETGEGCDTAIPPGLAGGCPTSCDDGVACTIDVLTGAGCAASCSHQAITSPASGDGCCPVGGDANNDSDCSATCGNGVYEPEGGESCDIDVSSGAGACPGDPGDCVDGNACTRDSTSGVGCNAACRNDAITNCASGDGCCPGSCNANTDSDCTSSCGNAVIEPGERCDTAVPSGNGACPAAGSCGDGNSCTRDVFIGSGCESECGHQAISAPVDGDGCCAADANTDTDCAASCGNGVLERPGETCDPNATGAADCPTSCSDGNACTTDAMTGSNCTTLCTHGDVTACVSGDGCCPSSSCLLIDSDCSVTCGNGTVESGETCDTAIGGGAGACPSAAACNDGNPATRDALESGATCKARCVHTPITTCTGGDGYCPAGCNGNTDGDCAVACGNGVVEGSESCDSGVASGAGACPTACNDGAACTTDTLQGSGCGRVCSYTPVTACIDGDGCCAAGCNSGNDDDCEAQCGNAIVEPGETCETGIASGPGACPRTCDDGDPSTRDSLENGGTCDARCVHTTINSCTGGDAFCPAGCNSNTDSDCAAACGNGIVETGESCDTALAGSCPTSCAPAGTCQSVQLTGAGTCDARCVYTDAPAPCCGNGEVETGELCDSGIATGQPGACPNSCNDGDACTVDTLYGAGCQLACANVFDVPSCPAPTGGQTYSQCGRIFDIATTRPLDDGLDGNGTPYRGVEVRIYDPIQFAAAPETTEPIATVYPNRCGWFEGYDLPRPTHGFSAPGVDDCEDPPLVSVNGQMVPACDEPPPGTDLYLPTGASAVVENGENERNMNVFFTTHATDQLWTQRLGLTGKTIVERGAYFPIVYDNSREGRLEEWDGPFEGPMVPGVRMTVAASAGPHNDYYFGDLDPVQRRLVQVGLTATGINGSAILSTLTTSVFTAGGSGNERTNPFKPAGQQACEWTSHPAAAIPGVVFVQERWPICCSEDSHCAADELCSHDTCYTSCTKLVNGEPTPDQSVCDALELELYDGRPDRQLKCLDESLPTGRFTCQKP